MTLQKKLRMGVDDGTVCHIYCNAWHPVPNSTQRGDPTMKSVILAFVLLSSSVASLAADNAAVGGKWNVHSSVAGNDSDVVCTFTQKDADLTGTCKTDDGEKKAIGKVEGTKISFSYNSDYNGTPLTVKYSGTFDSAANKIAGSVSVDPFGVDGDFTATPAK
jgi:hypothetical protein